jgi:hypothetical protein
MLARKQVRAQRELLHRSVLIGNLQQQRRAAMPVPGLNGVDAVPVRHLSVGQKKQDRRRMGPALMPHLVAKGLAIPAAFGMPLKSEIGDDVFRAPDFTTGSH